MKRKITCIGWGTAVFAVMFSYVCGLHDLMEEDRNMALTILCGTLYCMGIAGTALLGTILWILAFATGNTEETAEEGV